MLTLPYIYVINKVSDKEKNKITSNLKYHAKKNNFNEIKSLIIDNGGIEYANKKIEEYSSMAYDQINYFDSLIALTPGSSLPSRNSSVAPPPVET